MRFHSIFSSRARTDSDNDSLLITKDGFDNLTTAAKTVAEVEALTTVRQS